jgi:hypothetical protein
MSGVTLQGNVIAGSDGAQQQNARDERGHGCNGFV